MMKVFDDWAREEVKTAGDLAKQTVAEETLVGTLSNASSRHSKMPVFDAVRFQVADSQFAVNRSPYHESSCEPWHLRREGREHVCAQRPFTNDDRFNFSTNDRRHVSFMISNFQLSFPIAMAERYTGAPAQA